MQAIKDVASYDTAPARQHRAQVQYFARLWFESSSYDPGSYKWICDCLELNADYFRRRLFAVVLQPPRGWAVRRSLASRMQDSGEQYAERANGGRRPPAPAHL
jgi:hypothetical protein